MSAMCCKIGVLNVLTVYKAGTNVFTMFVDDLSHKLTHSNAGCHLQSVCINHLCYTDATVLIATSPSALQLFTSSCDEYATVNELAYI